MKRPFLAGEQGPFSYFPVIKNLEYISYKKILFDIIYRKNIIFYSIKIINKSFILSFLQKIYPLFYVILLYYT